MCSKIELQKYVFIHVCYSFIFLVLWLAISQSISLALAYSMTTPSQLKREELLLFTLFPKGGVHIYVYEARSLTCRTWDV